MSLPLCGHDYAALYDFSLSPSSYGSFRLRARKATQRMQHKRGAKIQEFYVTRFFQSSGFSGDKIPFYFYTPSFFSKTFMFSGDKETPVDAVGGAGDGEGGAEGGLGGEGRRGGGGERCSLKVRCATRPQHRVQQQRRRQQHITSCLPRPRQYYVSAPPPPITTRTQDSFSLLNSS